MENFNETSLRDDVKQAVAQLGFTTPTPVQAKTIPAILGSDRDLIALARTGTGKTAGFGLPVVDGIDTELDAVQALILCPTRELCLQISRDLTEFARFRKGVNVVAVYGGASAGDQIRAIRSGANIIVGTPGRTLDLINRKKLVVDQLKRVVLDEADEMLNMGFQEELNGILDATPREKQTLLFSATMPKEARKISTDYMNDPQEISIDHTDAGNSNITHLYYKVKGAHRFSLLKLLVELDPDMYAVIFCRTRREVDGVAEDLRFAGHAADALHGDMSQAQRDDVMKRFRKGRIKLLVATDVAARGLDVSDLTHVINYNLPDAPEVYVHRSGRTGRAGKEGVAISIVTGREVRKLRDIERYGKIEFTEAPIPSQEEVYRRRALRFVTSVKEATMSDQKLLSLMPEIVDGLADLDREALIQQFVALSLSDFSQQVGSSRPVEAGSDDKRERKSHDRRSNVSYTRLCMSAGRRQGYTVPQVIGMLNKNLPGKKIDLGKIDLQNNLTFIDVDSTEASRVVAALAGVQDRGNDVELRIYDGQAGGNDDGPRGKRPRNKYKTGAPSPGSFAKRDKKKHRKGQGK
ncbi:ATP-dependent RNA helicase DeaD [Lewinella marina]|uniref:DEAD/DEAH box helicase n=1 Tax=Neolewinella marina TaxID=438751 RepID=A0A2G0CFI2_9BACT|nr:DEAD/DEAH box helicase [Neolewinella marina]NJB85580.1 ATP-dependent RNA helicase DeaD [Neolewinella marina]PHK98736.1 DEAD/DEAH box helicase [Neolewinella marina]